MVMYLHVVGTNPYGDALAGTGSAHRATVKLELELVLAANMYVCVCVPLYTM